MPESVTDRPTKSHEYLFLLSKSARYYYDQEAVREVNGRESSWDGWDEKLEVTAKTSGNIVEGKAAWKRPSFTHPNGRNLRTVWSIPTEAFPQAHFATFPRRLVQPCILAGTSAKGACAHCGAGWERVVDVSYERAGEGNNNMARKGTDFGDTGSARPYETRMLKHTSTTGWHPICRCAQLYDPLPQIVLDPFAGSGTTGVVATQLGRRFVGIELSPVYAAMARRRIQNPEPEPRLEPLEGQLPLFSEV